MRNQKPLTKLYNILCLSIFSSSLISCSSIPERKGPSFDLSLVGKMNFVFEGNTRLINTELPKVEIRKNVISNLSEWGYQFSNQNTEKNTHNLAIHIGSIRQGSTPSGFSFSSGNSDPRALAFQKATILPLTCSLMPKGQEEQRAELVMEIMAEEYKGSGLISVSERQIITRITDDISTSCFNLLSNLNIKTVQSEANKNINNPKTKPTWIPKVRIEVENDIEEHLLQKNNKEDTKSIKAIPHKQSEEPRKRMIIHNQGNPIIFKFGPDR